MRDGAAKVPSNNTVPSPAENFVTFLLHVRGNILQMIECLLDMTRIEVHYIVSYYLFNRKLVHSFIDVLDNNIRLVLRNVRAVDF